MPGLLLITIVIRSNTVNPPSGTCPCEPHATQDHWLPTVNTPLKTHIFSENREPGPALATRRQARRWRKLLLAITTS